MAIAVFVIDLLIWGGETDTRFGNQTSFWLVFAIGVAGYGTLLIRSSPLLGYLSMMVLTVGSLFLPSAGCIAGFIMALFLMARHRPKRSALLALAGAVLPIAITTYNAASYYKPVTLLFVIINAALWTTLMAAAWIAGRALARNHHRLVVERRWAAEARDEATAVERLRISRDLHDSVAHSMTAIVLQVAGVRAVIKQGSPTMDIDQVLNDIQSTADQCMRELHRLLGMLRSENESGTDNARGLEEIAELIVSARDSGLETLAVVHGDVHTLDPSVSHAAYRVVQEGLSNAMKHAGEGSRVELLTEWKPEQLRITVRSISGVEVRTAASGGYGLVGLRERISVCGGTLQHGPTKDGYLLKAVLPVIGKSIMPGTTPFIEE